MKLYFCDSLENLNFSDLFSYRIRTYLLNLLIKSQNKISDGNFPLCRNKTSNETFRTMCIVYFLPIHAMPRYRPIFFDQVGHQTMCHLWKKYILLLNQVTVRPTKFMNNFLKDCKIRTFKVIFQHQKSTKSFLFFFL